MNRSVAVALCAAGLTSLAMAQPQYAAENVTGQLVRTGVSNAAILASSLGVSASGTAGPGFNPNMPRSILRAPFKSRLSTLDAPPFTSLGIGPATSGFSFAGLSHSDQRLANNQNQFSVEPPNPSIAAGSDSNGRAYVLQGVNNAIQVYDANTGSSLLASALSSNQLFGLAPAINRAVTPVVYGLFPTDMRVFFDQTIRRWFVLQRTWDNDTSNRLIPKTHIYLAVSQTADPTQNYTIYAMDTTHATNNGCPCYSDYLQVGADQYGFHIAANEFTSYVSDPNFSQFVDATILSISKASLAAGAPTPTAARFTLPFNNYEFAIQPATTPPNAAYFTAANGLEYFVSSSGNSDLNVSLWAMTNTASLSSGTPNLALAQTIVPTLTYYSPDPVNQKPGPIPYGDSLGQQLEFIDGNDTRILSVSYALGRLYTTLASKVRDENGKILVGGAYIILSPSFRNGVLSANVFRQGYLLVKNNNLLRPSVAVNSQGRGAIAFTLVGPDYYPSTAFVPIDTFSTGTTLQVAVNGAFPEDGFSGYQNFGISRWGDYSTAVAGSDGKIWMGAEYIPVTTAFPTKLANWGTFLTRYAP